jgi:hypothetical protein
MTGIGFERVGDGLYFYAVTKHGAGRLHFGWDGLQKAIAEYVLQEQASWYELLDELKAIADVRAEDLGLPAGWRIEADPFSSTYRVQSPDGEVVTSDSATLAEALLVPTAMQPRP